MTVSFPDWRLGAIDLDLEMRKGKTLVFSNKKGRILEFENLENF